MLLAHRNKIVYYNQWRRKSSNNILNHGLHESGHKQITNLSGNALKFNALWNVLGSSTLNVFLQYILKFCIDMVIDLEFTYPRNRDFHFMNNNWHPWIFIKPQYLALFNCLSNVSLPQIWIVFIFICFKCMFTIIFK